MNYDEKQVDRYYAISGVLRDLGYRGAGDYWWSREGFGSYSFDFLVATPFVQKRLRQLRYEKMRDSIVRVCEKMRVDMQPISEAAREANSVMRSFVMFNKVYVEQSEEEEAEEKALTDFGKRQAQRLFNREDGQEALEEMIANLGRVRLRAEAMELELSRPVPAKAIGVTVYAYGYDGKRYRKKVMARPNGTLPFSEFFNPYDPLSDGWKEGEKAAIDQYGRNDEEVADFVNEELHKMRRDGKAGKGE